MFLLLLTMAGPQANEIDWENMTKKELHDKFQQMLSQQVEDVMASVEKALERIVDIEKTINTKLDAKFDEVLASTTTTAHICCTIAITTTTSMS